MTTGYSGLQGDTNLSDTIANFENIDLSTATNAVLTTGDAGSNTLTGGAGSDFERVGASNDTLFSGAGNDHFLVALVMTSWCKMAVVARPMMAVKAPIHTKLISVYSA